MSGSLLRQDAVTVGADASILIDTDTFAARHGVYLLSLTSAAGQWSKKVVF
jgi:hypothetical protein